MYLGLAWDGASRSVPEPLKRQLPQTAGHGAFPPPTNWLLPIRGPGKWFTAANRKGPTRPATFSAGSSDTASCLLSAHEMHRLLKLSHRFLSSHTIAQAP